MTNINHAMNTILPVFHALVYHNQAYLQLYCCRKCNFTVHESSWQDVTWRGYDQ